MLLWVGMSLDEMPLDRLRQELATTMKVRDFMATLWAGFYGRSVIGTMKESASDHGMAANFLSVVNDQCRKLDLTLVKGVMKWTIEDVGMLTSDSGSKKLIEAVSLRWRRHIGTEYVNATNDESTAAVLRTFPDVERCIGSISEAHRNLIQNERLLGITYRRVRSSQRGFSTAMLATKVGLIGDVLTRVGLGQTLSTVSPLSLPAFSELKALYDPEQLPSVGWLINEPGICIRLLSAATILRGITGFQELTIDRAPFGVTDLQLSKIREEHERLAAQQYSAAILRRTQAPSSLEL